MAVLCACIPSLRPLFTLVTQGIFKHSLKDSSLHPSNHASSKSRWNPSKVKTSDSTFSQLDQPEDLHPLGQATRIRGGRIDNERELEEAVELPTRGITVRTEITWTTSDILDYDDRLF